MIPTLFFLVDKYFTLPFGSIRSLQFHSSNCGSVIYILLIFLCPLSKYYKKNYAPYMQS